MILFHNIITFVLISSIFSGLLAIPIISLLYHFRVVRKIEVDFSTLIEERKDKYGTPIMGGLIFVIAICIINLIFNLNIYTEIPLYLFAASALLGAIDDLLNIFGQPRKIKTLSRILKLIKVHKSIFVRIFYVLTLPWHLFSAFMHMFESNPGNGLRAHEKILIQTLIGGILGLWVYKVIGGILWIPILGTFDVGLWIIPITIFIYMATTNATNISDGMDGLASGMGVITILSVMMIATFSFNYPVALFAGSSVGALITYLYFNIKPARVQMGDTGSFALGALITILFFSIGKPFLILIAGFPFVVEISSTIVQSISRRLFGKRLLQMAPLHHHFEMVGWTEDKVVVRFWIISIACNLIALWLSFF